MPQKIIVDENVPDSVAKYLETRGFRVIRISEGFLKSAKDSCVANYAAKQGMPVLTLDSDFAKLYHNLFRGKITVLLVKANPPNAGRRHRPMSCRCSGYDPARRKSNQASGSAGNPNRNFP